MITVPQVSKTIRKNWVTHILREIMSSDKLSHGARLTYAILCGYRGKNCKEPYPSLPTLEKEVGSCRQTVQGYLDELEAKGIITSEQRRNKGGSFTSNTYQINDGIHGSPVVKKVNYGEDQALEPVGEPSPPAEPHKMDSSTVVKKHRYGKTPLRRNLTTKEYQSLKEYQDTKESQLKESIHPCSDDASRKSIADDSNPAASGMDGKSEGLAPDAPDHTNPEVWAKMRGERGI